MKQTFSCARSSLLVLGVVIGCGGAVEAPDDPGVDAGDIVETDAPPAVENAAANHAAGVLLLDGVVFSILHA